MRSSGGRENTKTAVGKKRTVQTSKTLQEAYVQGAIHITNNNNNNELGSRDNSRDSSHDFYSNMNDG